MIRVLSRRYPLTSTAYKYLEIGINVGPPSYVEIAIGDNRGNELIMSLETWKGLYEQRWNVLTPPQTDYKARSQADSCNFISTGPLTARICTIKNGLFIRLESQNICMIMNKSTLCRMLDLDDCVDAMFDRLVKFIDIVDVQFTRFSNIASTVTNPDQVPNAIRTSDVFDKYRLVDCELLALAFSM